MTIEDVLSVERLHEAGFTNVREVHISQGLDSTDYEAYYIDLLMDNSLKDADFEWKKIGPLITWADRQAWDFGKEKIIPYVSARRLKNWPATSLR